MDSTEATVTIESVSRQREADGGHCQQCDVFFNISTEPYWHWSKSVAMHRLGTGHKVTFYRVVIG